MASPALVAQRIRNRIIEYLQLVVAAEQATVRLKTSDMVNIWEDWVRMPSPEFPTPPFSSQEATALLAFAAQWEEFCGATERWPDSYAELFSHPAWPTFRAAASSALDVLAVRGPSLEDPQDNTPG